ncbi:MAG: NHL repeat-containing protein [Chloroflexota bacterium]|nr:NHL repeat-containing protein [Chloroflexota bacterium]
MLTTIAAGRTFDFSHCYGMYSMGGLGFWDPVDFAIGSSGMLYVVNRGAEELGQRISKSNTDHEFVTQFVTPGQGDGQLVWPYSIDLDKDENVYVSDEFLQRISIFDKDGKYLGKWGTPGNDPGQLNGPSGIAFDSNDDLYVVDSSNNRVQKFKKDGTFLLSWGVKGDRIGEFDRPWGICIDNDDDVYIADWKNSRIQKFSSDGVFLMEIGGPRNIVGALDRPSSVAVDQEGDIYVTDWGNNLLNVYASSGDFITSLVGDAQTPSPWAQTYFDANPEILKARRRVSLEEEWRFTRPIAVNVDANNYIYVAESVRHRIQIYKKELVYEEDSINL